MVKVVFTFNCRVQICLGGLSTRLRVKSPCTPQIKKCLSDFFPSLNITRIRDRVAEDIWGEWTCEMIPKAWYSMIELRLILAERPCCIPRSKRSTATLGEGWTVIKQTNKCSTERGANNFNFHFDLTSTSPWDQDAIELEWRDHWEVKIRAVRVERLDAHKIVMPATNQKSCWRMTCIPSKFHWCNSRS